MSIQIFKNEIYDDKKTIYEESILPMLIHYSIFRKTYKFLRLSEWWNQNEIEEFQIKKLRILLNHAYNNVSYYRKIFDKQNFKPNQLKDFKDIQKIPFLTKKIVRKNLKNLMAKNYPSYKFEYQLTGGSSGKATGFYIEKNVYYAEEFAYLKIILKRMNCNLTNKFIYLRKYNLPMADKGKFWKYSLFGRCLILSIDHMTEQNLPKYVEKIDRFKPKFIIAYPSSIIILARFMEKNNIKLSCSLKTILCSAEKLNDWQCTLIEKIFRCRPIDIYGCAERVAMSATCEKSYYHHIFPEYGYTELINREGFPVTKEGELGEIVGTGFNNFIFPFIRYRTGDLARYTRKKCNCGRHQSLFLEIEGRTQDFIVTKTKRLIPIISGVYSLIAKSSPNIKECQLYQDKEGEIELNIVKGINYTQLDESLIKKNFQKKFGYDMILKIQLVDEIPKTFRGKQKFFIQKLPIEDLYL